MAPDYGSEPPEHQNGGFGGAAIDAAVEDVARPLR